jgi:gliding motility-associated-like protein
MKSRYILIFTIFLLCYRAYGQPSEVIYDGTTIAVGFKQSILSSDGPFPIGFTFSFFETPYTQFYVSANGLVMFTDPDNLYDTESTIPTSSTPNNFIAPFWDNLSIVDGGNILYKTIGASPNRKCIIQFKNMGFDPVPTPLGTFSVILYENSDSIKIQYRLIVDNYSPLSHGLSATIGLENSGGTNGVLYAFHDGNAIHSEDAISFVPSGSTYTVKPNTLYDGVFLTTTLAPPDPGIVNLVTPPEDAVIGANQTFEWSAASDADSYTLVIDTLSSLATAGYYNAGLNLSYNITDLNLDTTYYWAVFSSNVTATTWCEIKRFKTASVPPLAPVSKTIWAEQLRDTIIKLQYTGGNASSKTAIITSLPAQGQLYQYNAGLRGSQITLLSLPAAVTDPAMNVIYAATGSSGNGAGNFNFKINDTGGDSPLGTITINVSPPGVPNVLYVAKNTNVEIQFDLPMANPAGRQNQFTVNVNTFPVTITSASLKTGDPYTILLTLQTPLATGDVVLLSYTRGDIASVQGGWLLSFTSQSVTLTAQTITFNTNLNKIYGDPSFALSATSGSGLTGFTYSSTNQSVATISSSTLTIKAGGTSDITARQEGNATFAPAKYIKTLTVSKAILTVTADAKTKAYGTANPALTFQYSGWKPGDDPADLSTQPTVNTTVNLTTPAGVYTGVITLTGGADESYTFNYIPAAFTVTKAMLTVTADAMTKAYGEANPTLTFQYNGWMNSDDATDLTTIPVAGTTVDLTTPVGVNAGAITVSGGADENYDFNYVPADFTVSKADLTFTADDKTKVFQQPNPELTFVISGFANGETQSVLDVLPDIQTTAVQNSSVGSYSITISGGDDNNYNYIYVSGTLTVTKFQQTISFTDFPEKLLVEDSYTLVASSTSGLTVLFESMDTQKATVTGDQLTGISKGTVEIRAYHPGDLDYDPAEAFVTVEVFSSHKDIMHLFTPNGDAFNNYWELPELATWGKCEVKVFNRWGKLVFTDADYNNLWDGTSKGNPLPEGAYYFVIKTENAGTVKGTVNIVR